MKTIKEQSKIEVNIKKSRFIGLSFKVSSQDDAKKILDGLKKEYLDATHICFAYKLSNTAKMSDDGEPQGTAGKPIYEILNKRNLINTLVVVVRYFGGIKLGAGGLTRAYLDTAVKVLDVSGEEDIVEQKQITFNLGLDKSKYINILLNLPEVLNIDVSFSEVINIFLSVKSKEVNNTISKVENILGERLNYQIKE